MGFGKYHEDIVSRYVNDTRDREPSLGSPVPPQEIKSKPEAKQGMKQMTGLKQFQMSSARPLPVIVLADVSGSMGADGKIEALNAALKEMIKTFSTESRLRAEIQVSLITFGGAQAATHLPLTPAHEVSNITPLVAAGGTPLGSALETVMEMLENKEIIPSRAYRPVLVLVSDGLPTDDWKQAFLRLTDSERAKKASRLAMAIGSDADEEMLQSFTQDVEAPLFKAHNARDIFRFFRAVTMSVTTKSQSPNPDQSAVFVIDDLPEGDFLKGLDC